MKQNDISGWIGIFIFVFLCLFSQTLFSQVKGDYWTKFKGQCQSGISLNWVYTSTSSSVNVHELLGASEISFTVEDVQQAGQAAGINLPPLVLNQLAAEFSDYSLALPEMVERNVAGFREVKSATIATPYVSFRTVWMSGGRTSTPDPLKQPGNLLSLFGHALKGDTAALVTQVGLLSLDAGANQQSGPGMISGEVSIRLKNLVFFKLDQPVYRLGDKIWWDWDMELTRVWSFDASRRLSLLDPSSITSELDALVDGGIFEDESDQIASILAGKIVSRTSFPLNPFHKGGKISPSISIGGKSWDATLGGYFESVSNGTRGSGKVNTYGVSVAFEKRFSFAASGRNKEIPKKKSRYF